MIRDDYYMEHISSKVGEPSKMLAEMKKAIMERIIDNGIVCWESLNISDKDLTDIMFGKLEKAMGIEKKIHCLYKNDKTEKFMTWLSENLREFRRLNRVSYSHPPCSDPHYAKSRNLIITWSDVYDYFKFDIEKDELIINVHHGQYYDFICCPQMKMIYTFHHLPHSLDLDKIKYFIKTYIFPYIRGKKKILSQKYKRDKKNPYLGDSLWELVKRSLNPENKYHCKTVKIILNENELHEEDDNGKMSIISDNILQLEITRQSFSIIEKNVYKAGKIGTDIKITDII